MSGSSQKTFNAGVSWEQVDREVLATILSNEGLPAASGNCSATSTEVGNEASMTAICRATARYEQVQVKLK